MIQKLTSITKYKMLFLSLLQLYAVSIHRIASFVRRCPMALYSFYLFKTAVVALGTNYKRNLGLCNRRGKGGAVGINCMMHKLTCIDNCNWLSWQIVNVMTLSLYNVMTM